MAYPRSPLDTIGGLYHLARMIDKVWLNYSGDLPEEYKERLGKGMDGYLCKFLGVEYKDIAEQVEAGKGDDEILEWCYQHGTPRSEFDRMLLNKFLENSAGATTTTVSPNVLKTTSATTASPTARTSRQFLI